MIVLPGLLANFVMWGAILGLLFCDLATRRGLEVAAAWFCGWYQETRPFCLPAAVFHLVIVWADGDPPGAGGFWNRIIAIFSVLAWSIIGSKRWHDHSDDRWKRRRKKLAGKIGRVGSRLTVVPAGSRT